MSGFEAVASDIRDAAGQIEAAGEGVKGADPSGRIGDVKTALPGSDSATAAGNLVDKWRTRFQGWADDAGDQAQRLRDSANEYDNSDYLADVRMRQRSHRMGLTAE
ncbi:hypothetical protein [Nocardioides marmoraquaticus]